jgi:toxin ParE1/3/4
MTYTLHFVPEVEDDAVAGYVWYEGKAAGLGRDFLCQVYACADAIAEQPLLSPRVYHRFRRRLLVRFPFAVYFSVEGSDVIVFGAFHCARDPWAVRSSLDDRESHRDR